MKPTWTGLLPMLLSVVESGSKEGKAEARKQLELMARAADRSFGKGGQIPRTGPTLRKQIIDVLESAGKPVHVNALSKVTGIPGTRFASIIRDEKMVKKNRQGRTHIIRVFQDGEHYLSLSTNKENK